jgi:hypothetical protein
MQSRLALLSAGFVLVLSVLQFYMLYTWLGAIVEDSQGPDITAFARGMTVSAGVMFTRFLLLVYVPIALIHQAWVDDLVHHAGLKRGDRAKSAWLKEQGLDQSPTDLIASGAALLGPVIAGFLPQLLQ